MKKFSIIFFIAVLIACGLGCQIAMAKTMWNIKSLSTKPVVYEVPECQPMGSQALFYDGLLNTPKLREIDSTSKVRSLYFEGLPYKSEKTRVFAFYGVPAEAKVHSVPAVVLVHGGGGTAYESWVRLWNAHGYAAIAFDTCGCYPSPAPVNQVRHQWDGPDLNGVFSGASLPVTDQWPYHAVADAVLAHSLLLSMPEVDPSRTGIVGISWGGFLTCIASSIDSRYKFVVSTYGCGFIGDNSIWLDEFEKMGADARNEWLSRWDPSVYLTRWSAPVLWISGSNDLAYPMDSLQKSYRLPKSPRTLCIRTDMVHGHGGPGETPSEIFAFADTYCKQAKPMIRITSQGRDGNTAWVKYDRKTKPVNAILNYTSDLGKWPERHWESISCKISEDGKVSVELPSLAKVYYFNLIDDRGLLVSSEYKEI